MNHDPQLRWSDDVTKFSAYNVNRPWRRHITDRVKKSLLHCGGEWKPFPLLACVDPNNQGKFLVIDGQNRLRALTELRDPPHSTRIRFSYFLCNGTEMSDILPYINGNWTISDYFSFHIQKGNPEYIAAADFAKVHGIDDMVAMTLLSGCSADGGGVYRDKIRFGQWKIADQEFADMVMRTFHECTEGGFTCTNKCCLLKALAGMHHINDFPWRTFARKVSRAATGTLAHAITLLRSSSQIRLLHQAIETILNTGVGDAKKRGWAMECAAALALKGKGKVK